MAAEGIILAGGFSSRAGGFKVKREILGIPMIERVITTMSSVCDHIVVVTGYQYQLLAYLPSKFPSVTLVHNNYYPLGMFSSVLVGCTAVSSAPSWDRVFLIPGDCPAVSKDTYQKMAHPNWDILIPAYNGQPGHPVLFTKAAIKALLKGKFSTLQEFVDSYGYEMIEVKDHGILLDIDYPGDFKKTEDYLGNIK